MSEWPEITSRRRKKAKLHAEGMGKCQLNASWENLYARKKEITDAYGIDGNYWVKNN